MADHIDDVAVVAALVRALLRGRFTGEDDGPARRELLDHMAGLRARIESLHRGNSQMRLLAGLPLPHDVASKLREADRIRTPRPRDEWRESDGHVLWWRLPVVEPPYVGDLREDDFPDDLTHWTPLPVVQEPVRAPISEHGECPGCALGECREHDAQSPCEVFVHVRDAAAIRTRDCGGDGHRLCRTCAAYEEP